MAILQSMFESRKFKIRWGWFRLPFTIGARQQALRAEDLVASGFSEQQAIESVKDTLDWLDQVL